MIRLLVLLPLAAAVAAMLLRAPGQRHALLVATAALHAALSVLAFIRPPACAADA